MSGYNPGNSAQRLILRCDDHNVFTSNEEHSTSTFRCTFRRLNYSFPQDIAHFEYGDEVGTEEEKDHDVVKVPGFQDQDFKSNSRTQEFWSDAPFETVTDVPWGILDKISQALKNTMNFTKYPVLLDWSVLLYTYLIWNLLNE